LRAFGEADYRAALLLALSPWHLVMSRLAHESALTPLFPVLILWFLDRGGAFENGGGNRKPHCSPRNVTQQRPPAELRLGCYAFDGPGNPDATRFFLQSDLQVVLEIGTMSLQLTCGRDRPAEGTISSATDQSEEEPRYPSSQMGFFSRMGEQSTKSVTRILRAAVRGDERAAAELLPLVYEDLQRYADAETALLEAYGILKTAHSAEHKRTVWVIELLIDLYDAWDKPEQAAEWRAELESLSQASLQDAGDPAAPWVPIRGVAQREPVCVLT